MSRDPTVLDGDGSGGPVVRVPASSANLGPGLDVLGLALGLHATAGLGVPPPGAREVDAAHPAAVAFAEAGGHGTGGADGGTGGGAGGLWVHAPIPMGRGLGYSGAVRVAGATLAIARSDPGLRGALPDDRAADVVDLTGRLEGHRDNVAASVHGGVVVVAGTRVERVPLGFAPAVLVWVAGRSTTSTDRSRSSLVDPVPRSDAVFNLGRVASLVIALAAGDVDALDRATEDRLHQAARFARVPDSRRALELGRELGAWCGWLSGSGPSVAFLCDPSTVAVVATGLDEVMGDQGHSKVLTIDRDGTRVLRPD
jgi:homoserine kinase